MKKVFLLFIAATISLSAMADEGMWLLPYLQKMNIKAMQDDGCKLTAEDIYSVNNSSLKDAIVIFGGGCTGEIVSSEGLLFTNHHCGFGNIQSLSSVEHDYLKNGFWAMNNGQEIPAPGLEVRFIRQIGDVTAQMLGNVPSIAKGEEREDILNDNYNKIVAELQEANPGKEIVLKSFFGGNQFFSFVIDVFKDVRLVGTPPTSIGKFGGDTDNWMWPRHTGDFSIFRVYANSDNEPAEYSSDNVPYKTDSHLKISLNGYEEGDFAMIMGFPGSTERYMTSFEIDRMLEIENPQRIFVRGERQKLLMEDMLASDKVRIQYASKYARSSNYWKNSIGMSRGIEKLHVKADKQAQEEAFQKWAVENTLLEEGYVDALDMIKSSVEQGEVAFASLQYINETLRASVEIMGAAAIGGKAWSKMPKQDIIEMLEGFYKDHNSSTDRKVAKRMFQIAKENIKDKPSIFADVIEKDFAGDTDKYVDYLYDNSAFASLESALELIESGKKGVYMKDPAALLYKSVLEKSKELSEAQSQSKELFTTGHRLYIDGLMKMNPEKSWYPDANFTLRLTYGQVLPYDPVDGVTYKYYTTLKGIIEKEDLANPTEFTVEAKLKELYEAKDYGRYADCEGSLPVAFLANCDITGGNSGSPIMNGNGELIGLAFDGNWEAMSGDVAFEPALQRTISVDVRYVLFIVDKFAGAGWLLDEMTIVDDGCATK